MDLSLTHYPYASRDTHSIACVCNDLPPCHPALKTARDDRSGRVITCIFLSLFFLIYLFCLQGCASSSASRDANNGVQSAYQGASTMFSGEDDTNVIRSFQNSSQTTKGALIGGATGAIAGGMTSGVGVIPGAAGGAIFGGAIGAYIDSKTTIEDRLENRGCKAIILGDQILIVIPTRYLFADDSADFIPYAYSTLNLVAQLVNRYPNMTVRIAAYTNPVGVARIKQALSQDQANNVERYLWRAGIHTRLLYAAGMGGQKPIAKPAEDDGPSINNRIEITLEKLPI